MAKWTGCIAVAIVALTSLAGAEKACETPNWAELDGKTITDCTILGSTELSAVAASCNASATVRLTFSDGELTLNLDYGTPTSAFYSANVVDFTKDPEGADVMTLLAEAQTCLQDPKCNRPDAQSDVLSALDGDGPMSYVGQARLNVVAGPATSGGLLDTPLAGGLASNFAGNPPLTLHYVLIDGGLFQVFRDPVWSLLPNELHTQFLGAQDTACQR